MQFDTVVANGRWFDGTGAPSGLGNIGVKDGRVAAITAEPLDTTGADVIDPTSPALGNQRIGRFLPANGASREVMATA